MRIVVADDIAENRYFLEVLFRGHGYEVTTARNGEEALAALQDGKAELVLADILMPVMDGYQLCRMLKADARLARIPLVFYTATYTSDEDRDFALGLGASRFLIKPMEPEELIEIVRDVIAEAERGPVGVAAPAAIQPPNFHREHDLRVTRKLEHKIEELEAARSLLQDVVHSMGEGLAVIGPDYRIRIANPAYAALADVAPDTLTGLTCFQATRCGQRPCDDEACGCPVRETFRTGVPSTTSHALASRGGGKVEAEIRSYPIKGPSGEVTAVIEIVRDISERLRAEEDLRRLTAAVDQSGESVVITDTEGTILYANPAFERVTGYTRLEALGKKASILRSGKHSPEFYKALWDTIRGGKSWVGRFVNRRNDGTLYEEESVISPVRDNNGAIVNYVAVQRDVTEETALRRQLEQAQKMEAVGRLAGGIAHDFNNLLTVILGRANLTLGASIEDGVRADVEEIQGAAERAAALTNQLLVFSRKQVLQPRIVDLSDVVEGVGKILRRLIGEDIEVVTVLSRELPAVRVDQGQMEQVILNLGVNARDAMPRGGRLTIETAEVSLDQEYVASHASAVPGRHVMLAVSDTGTGMDSETKARIFDPFFTTKETGKGTGLGLSVVHGIVQQSGGSIWVYSEVGQGTTFKIYLPPAPERAGPKPTALPDFVPRGDETILLVEDEAAVRRLAAVVLRANGYTVLEAGSGDEALLLLAKTPGRVHLLLTDFVMPRMTGRELAEHVRAARPKTRVLYMSGYTDTGFADQVAPEPFDFLQKPFTRSALAQRVREVLDRA